MVVHSSNMSACHVDNFRTWDQAWRKKHERADVVLTWAWHECDAAKSSLETTAPVSETWELRLFYELASYCSSKCYLYLLLPALCGIRRWNVPTGPTYMLQRRCSVPCRSKLRIATTRSSVYFEMNIVCIEIGSLDKMSKILSSPQGSCCAINLSVTVI